MNLFKYVNIATITLVAVYILIAVGGIVRSTGSGMGCPDWPKCFGNYIPPTDISQLPTNYKEIFAEKRKQKNLKLVKYMKYFGRVDLAQKLKTDPTLYVEETFNPVKTWIEYINRLVGVVIGLLIFATLLSSVSYFKRKPIVFWLSLFAFVLTGFQAWIGSIVVSTNLLEGVITLHMFLAVLLVIILILAIFKAMPIKVDTIIHHKNPIRILVLIGLVLVFAQTMLGTQVREGVDQVALRLGQSNRHLWITSLDDKFLIHRSFSWIVLLLNAGLVFIIFKYNIGGLLRKNIISIGGITILQIISGILMAYLSIPPFLQPIHLLFSVVMLGQLFFVLLYLYKQNDFFEQNKK